MSNVAHVWADLVMLPVHLNILRCRRHRAQNFRAVFPVVVRFTGRSLDVGLVAREVVSLMVHLILRRLLLVTSRVDSHSSTS